MYRIALLISGVLMINLFWTQSVQSKTPSVEIQGHRGARASRAENTLAAFKYALEHNVQTLEMDISYTKDEKLVINHDPSMNPDICLDPKGQKITKKVLVNELTLKEFQKYDCGSLINPRFPKQTPSPKEKMPTYEEVLALVRTFDKSPIKTKMNVEIKMHNDFIKSRIPKIVKEVIAVTKKYKLYDRINLQSFDIDVIKEVRKQDSKIPLAYLIEEKMEDVLKKLKLKNTKELIAKYKFNILSPSFNLITKDEVKDFQSQGVKVIPWTVDDPKDWKLVLDMGVDGIITDDPVGLKLFLTPQVSQR